MEQVKTNRFTDAEMTIAKETDLPDLLSHLGYSVRRIGSYYTTREMDSIRIKNRRSWRRYSTSQRGNAITFLQEFCGKGFQEAVEFLLDFHGRARDSPTAQRPRPPPVEVHGGGLFRNGKTSPPRGTPAWERSHPRRRNSDAYADAYSHFYADMICIGARLGEDFDQNLPNMACLGEWRQ